MFTEMKKRKYQQKRRAEQAEQTRQQIVEAAMYLHEQLGPALTSIKAVAEQAGVQRLTVYRHFPDENSLFEACTSHWLAKHPLPEMSEWSDLADAKQCTAQGLLLFYRYYRKTERMWKVSYRDVDEVTALQEPMMAIENYLDHVRDNLMAKWDVPSKDKKFLSITLRHCLRYSTWHSLKIEKLSDRKIVELVMSWFENY
jgi:AcrR family transcriptional regulator